MNQTIICNAGAICTHEGPCDKNCGGDHYFHTDGSCLRCGKFDGTKATQPPLASKGKKLKLWNGRWNLKGGRGHCYVAAYSQADVLQLALAAGANPRGMLGEIQNYWSAGAWGRGMDGIEPERGIWLTADDAAKPIRQALNFTIASARKSPANPRSKPAFDTAKVDARRANAVNWYTALLDQIAEQKALIEQLDFPRNSDFHGNGIMTDIRQERLELLQKLLQFEKDPRESATTANAEAAD